MVYSKQSFHRVETLDGRVVFLLKGPDSMKTNAAEIVDERAHPISRALSHAMDEIHADYEAVMARRRDKEGNFDPLKLPDDRPCIRAGSDA